MSKVNYITRQQLERLQSLLQQKLQKLAASKIADVDTELSCEILRFVEFLVDKQISVCEQHGGAQSTYWSTHTGSVLPYGGVTQANNSANRPNTICDVCWHNSNGSHTHCTHMFMNDAGDVY